MAPRTKTLLLILELNNIRSFEQCIFFNVAWGVGGRGVVGGGESSMLQKVRVLRLKQHGCIVKP